MDTSAVNRSGNPIYAGCAVSINGTGAVLASPTKLATALAADGAPVKGVVTLITSGVLSLNNWTMATGSKRLTPGATYAVLANGKIGISTKGQTVGIANNDTDLNVSIASTAAPYVVVSSPVTVLTAGSTIIGGAGAPKIEVGKNGDYFLDAQANIFYGPKTGGNWGKGFPFVS